MKDFSAFTVSFCAVCGVVGGVFMLCPKGNISKSVKYVINLTVICAFIGLLSVALKFDFKIPENKEYTVTTETAEKTATMVFENALKNSNIKFTKIIVFTNKTANDGISISKVTVFSNENPERIKEVICKNGDFEVNVVNE